MDKLLRVIMSKDDTLAEENNPNTHIFFVFAVSCWFLLAVAQFIMFFWFSGKQISDAARYLSIAIELAERGKWYPSVDNLSSEYLFGNGYINFIILCLRIFGNIKAIYLFNILFVHIILCSCLYILKKSLNSNNIMCWFIILFCLFNTFWSEVVHLRTELPFTALCFLSFALVYSEKRYTYIVSGIVLGIANWVRPLGIAFMMGLIGVIVYKDRHFRNIWRPLISYVAVIMIIGTTTYSYCGHFVYQSTTLGVNLMMSANDKADGSYMNVGEIAPIPSEQRKKMIFKDVDKYYKEKSIEWIFKNPEKYFSQIPRKLFYLFGTETYSGSSYYNNEIATGGIDYIKSIYDKIMNKTEKPLVFADFLVCFNQIWYMIIFTLFLLGFLASFKANVWRWSAPYIITLFAGTAITLIVVGGARYHFPYNPIFIMYAAFFLDRVLKVKEKNK